MLARLLILLVLPWVPSYPAVGAVALPSGKLEKSSGGTTVLRADSQSPNQTRRNAARMLAAAALSRAWQVGLFERLEPRTFLDGTTVVDDLSPESSTAGYLVDLAAGENTAPPPQNAAPATSTTTEATVVVVSQPTGDSTGTGETPASQPSAPARTPTTDLNRRSPADFRYVLRPGSGWTGATQEPARYGSGPYTDAKAIARWDVVPFQTFTDRMNVGVVAFHAAGISRVEISVNDGPWAAISDPAENPETAGNGMSGVTEYWASVVAADFQDGAVELRAIAYPVVGQPRLLDPLILYANSNRTLGGTAVYVSPAGSDSTGDGTQARPYASFMRAVRNLPAGSTMKLARGVYSVSPDIFWRHNVDRWITVEPVDGATRDDVIIRGDKRPGVNRVKWSNVTFDFADSAQYYPEENHYVWFDGCRWTDTLGWTHNFIMQRVRSSFYIGDYYATNCAADNMPNGFTDAGLVRNCTMYRISGDAVQNSALVINCTVDTMDGVIPDLHLDVAQYFGRHSNVIVYGLAATNIQGSQGIFLDKTDSVFGDMAFVDISIDAVGDPNLSPPYSQLASACTNILFRNVTADRSMVLRTDFTGTSLFVPVNVLFEGCSFPRIVGVPLPGVEVR